MNTLYHAEAQIANLRRSAEREHLAHIARAGRQNRGVIFYQQSRRYLGQGFIWLGSRLHEPVCQPVTASKPVATGNTTLILSECC
ncbi:MAG: hypothetical protein ABI690_02990 [Chloroflexota bacterium]